jgi:acetyl-CoA carboxylase alpha subunit
MALTVLGWFFKREVNRLDKKLEKVDELDKKKADKDDLKDAITQWRIESADATQSRAKLYERVNQIAEGVAELRGARNGANNGVK